MGEAVGSLRVRPYVAEYQPETIYHLAGTNAGSWRLGITLLTTGCCSRYLV